MAKILIVIREKKLLAVLPLLLLLIDILLFPILFHTHKTINKISVSELLRDKNIYLGRYKIHRIYVSVDNIYEENYLNHLPNSKTALLISHFINKDRNISRFGTLGRAVNYKLDKISLRNSRNFNNLIKKSPDYSAGKMLEFPLQLTSEPYQEFPVNNIYVVLFNESGNAEENLEIIKKIFPEIMLKAKSKHVKNLVIPPLCIKPKDRNSQLFQNLFANVFQAFSMGKYPANIYFSLFSEWPTQLFEHAVDSLDDTWNSQFDNIKGKSQFIFKSDYRMSLIFLSLCLFISSFAAPLTLKNFLIICLAFPGLLFGSTTVLRFFTSGYHPDLVLLIKSCLFLLIAVFFRYIIYWDPKNIFKN